MAELRAVHLLLSFRAGDGISDHILGSRTANTVFSPCITEENCCHNYCEGLNARSNGSRFCRSVHLAPPLRPSQPVLGSSPTSSSLGDPDLSLDCPSPCPAVGLRPLNSSGLVEQSCSKMIVTAWLSLFRMRAHHRANSLNRKAFSVPPNQVVFEIMCII